MIGGFCWLRLVILTVAFSFCAGAFAEASLRPQMGEASWRGVDLAPETGGESVSSWLLRAARAARDAEEAMVTSIQGGW